MGSLIRTPASSQSSDYCRIFNSLERWLPSTKTSCKPTNRSLPSSTSSSSPRASSLASCVLYSHCNTLAVTPFSTPLAEMLQRFSSSVLGVSRSSHCPCLGEVKRGGGGCFVEGSGASGSETKCCAPAFVVRRTQDLP